MFNKKLFISIATVFATFLVFDWIFHGYFMASTYQATQYLWRSEAQMHDYHSLILLGQFILATTFCLIFKRGYEGRGIPEGIRYGCYIAILMSAPQLIMHAVSPYTLGLTVSWVAANFIEFALAGTLLAMIWRAEQPVARRAHVSNPA